MNVSINDIKEIETELSITLTDLQRDKILNEYNTIITDKAEGWDELIKHLIIKQTTIQILIEKNKQKGVGEIKVGQVNFFDSMENYSYIVV